MYACVCYIREKSNRKIMCISSTTEHREGKGENKKLSIASTIHVQYTCTYILNSICSQIHTTASIYHIALNFQGALFLQIGNTGCFMETISVDQGFMVHYVIHRKTFCGLNSRGNLRKTQTLCTLKIWRRTVCTLSPQMFNGYGDLLYQFGMADENEKAHIDSETAQGVEFIKRGDYYNAFLVRGSCHTIYT